MAAHFTEEHEMFRKTVRSFLEKEIIPHIDEWEEKEQIPRWIWKRMGDMGFFGLRYPEEYGGTNVDYWYNVVLVEELSKVQAGGFGMSVTVHMNMATPALARHGSQELKQRFLEPAIRGEFVSAIAVTEPDAGSDVAAIQTKARREGDHYVINGRKMFITNGTQADFVTTLVKTAPDKGHYGFTLLVVPTNTPGFSVGRKLKKLGNHCSDTAELIFDEVRVPVSNRIGDEGMGFIYQMEQFQDERLSACLSVTSGAFNVYEYTKEYALTRQVFGRPVLGFQVNQFRFVEMLTKLTALRALVYQCCDRYVQGEDITCDISMCKIFAGEVSGFVVDSCLQMHGGYGYMDEFPISRAFRDNRLFRIGAGADEVMKSIVAKMEGLMPEKKPGERKSTRPREQTPEAPLS
jgi:citronellyl-CoA dehydrogenase